jgi:hypothetical protein
MAGADKVARIYRVGREAWDGPGAGGCRGGARFPAGRVLLALALLAAAGSLAAEDKSGGGASASPGTGSGRPAAAADGLKRALVFPYLDQDGSLGADQRFALYAVPDMVRITLMEDPELVLVEKAEMEGLPDAPAAQASENGRRELARRLGADHYVWGYLVQSAGKLTVFHHIVDTASGRTVHMQYDSLPADAGIFDSLADSARDFAAWIRRSLPPRREEPRVVVETVEKTVEREVPVDRPVPLAAADRGALTFGGNLVFIVGELAPYLETTGAVHLAYTFGKGLIEPLRFGLRIDVGLLRQKGGSIFGGGSIDILNPSLDLSLAWPLVLGGGISLVPELDGGASVIFGRVNDSLISYVRPQLGLDLALRAEIVPEFQIGAGFRAAAVFAAWQTQTMVCLSPFVDLVFRP